MDPSAPKSPPLTCRIYSNYLFTDPDGGRHPLYLSAAMRESSPPACSSQVHPSPVLYASGGDGEYAAVMQQRQSCFCGPQPVTVTDPDGAQYQFNGTKLESFNGVALENDELLPDWIQDRNGNRIVITDHGGGNVIITDTLNRQLLSTSGFGGLNATNTDTITVAGEANPYIVTWENISYSFTNTPSNYGIESEQCNLSTNPQTGTLRVIQSIGLPNGQTYQFQYDSQYGYLNKIIYPGGASVSYTWGVALASDVQNFSFFDHGQTQYCNLLIDRPSITDRYVNFAGDTHVHWDHFTFPSPSFPDSIYPTWTTRQTAVAAYDLTPGNGSMPLETVTYTYAPTSVPNQPNMGGLEPQIPVEGTVARQDSSGKVLRTENKTWINPREMPRESVTLDNGSSTTTIRCFDVNDQVTQVDEYGSASEGAAAGLPTCPAGSGTEVTVAPPAGPLLRQTITSFASFSGQHIVDRPQSVEVDGLSNGAWVAPAGYTWYCYDKLSLTASNAINHVDPGTTARGNLTERLQWLNPPGAANALPNDANCSQPTASANILPTAWQYDDAGQVLSSTDPGQHTTNYTWGDAASSPVSGTDAFLLQVQDPVTSSPNRANHVESYTWDYATGHLLSHTGQNPGETTSYAYADPLNRLTDIQFPDQGETKVTYGDSPGDLYTEVKRKIDSTRWTDVFTYFDGLGHAMTTCQANGDSSLPWDRVDTQYDGEGRAAFRSYPYAATNCTGANSEPGDTFGYDALDRPLTVTHSDGGVLATSYGGAATGVADEGNAVDASGAVTQRVTRVLQHDGLGRLTAVCEVSGSLTVGADRTAVNCGLDLAATGFLTTYQYDALGDLTGVHQGSGIADRSFSYDSLGRLLSGRNPESGTTSYGYDSDGNLIRKQDANGTVASYAYDPLRRLTSRSFTLASGVAATPNVELDYDSDPTGRTTYNAVGHLTRVWNGQVELSFNQYDAMGRAQVLDTAIGGSSYHTSLSFDRIGYPTWERLPSGRQLYLTDDVEGRPRWIGDGQYTSFTYVSARYYNAAGQPDDEFLGNGLLQGWHHDARGRLIKVDLEDPNHSAYSNWRMDLDISYLPDSDVTGLVDNLGGSGQNQTYAYDALNRLSQWTTSAGLNCGFAVDRYGNLAPAAANSACGMPGTWSFTPANQIQGRSYDADGNLLSDGVGQSWVWNGENQLAGYQVTSPSHSAQYEYDGLGRRVENIADGVTTLFLCTALGPVADEVTGSTWTDSIHVPGAERVAPFVISPAARPTAARARPRRSPGGTLIRWAPRAC